ncbi:hypothetical protein N0V93_009683 [Gnomoniopsis smithogilvyi]|uniref:Vacuolar protein sorting-associated protein 62 n=1 Tax=Gnomoniopsis smithogilvyi TaxID=1191159 RepID=A0A9W9CSX3_9PEZI|nr:hypothetical protein N0V93_009683 [Gnomoniopsis smithogilvyi]
MAAVASMVGMAADTIPEFVTPPLVWLHSDDLFRPSDLLQHIRHTTPMINMEPLDGLPEITLENLALLNEKATGNGPVALTAKDDITAFPAWLYGETPGKTGKLENSTACVVILVESKHESSNLDAFYFYFYSYNRGVNITSVLPPIQGLLEGKLDREMYFGDHVGDWEYNMIRFRDGSPTGIYLSHHSDGSAYGWDDEALTIQNNRPLVYSAIGSHANWVSPGSHVHDSVILDHCNAGQQWDPVASAYFYRFNSTTSDLTRILQPGSAKKTSNLTSFIYFSGLWGDAQYPDDNPRQRTVPFFGLKRFVSGPTGPMSKQLVRKRLFPDHQQAKSWTQWGLHIFMALYPCCFRGWRAWVTGVMFMGLVICLVLGIRHIVRKYLLKAKGYNKVDSGADVPLDALRYRDDNHESRDVPS